MTALTLPRRRQPSKPARIAKGAAKTWTSMKVGSAAASTAKKGAKAYGSWKVTKFVSGKFGKILLVPVAVGGGLVAWTKLRSSSSDDNGAAAPVGSSSGPAAAPQTVTPPKTAPGSPNGEAAAGEKDEAAPPPGATS
jgi:hypothetical protein